MRPARRIADVASIFSQNNLVDQHVTVSPSAEQLSHLASTLQRRSHRKPSRLTFGHTCEHLVRLAAALRSKIMVGRRVALYDAIHHLTRCYPPTLALWTIMRKCFSENPFVQGQRGSDECCVAEDIDSLETALSTTLTRLKPNERYILKDRLVVDVETAETRAFELGCEGL